MCLDDLSWGVEFVKLMGFGRYEIMKIYPNDLVFL